VVPYGIPNYAVDGECFVKDTWGSPIDELTFAHPGRSARHSLVEWCVTGWVVRCTALNAKRTTQRRPWWWRSRASMSYGVEDRAGNGCGVELTSCCAIDHARGESSATAVQPLPSSSLMWTSSVWRSCATRTRCSWLPRSHRARDCRPGTATAATKDVQRPRPMAGRWTAPLLGAVMSQW